MFVITVTYAPSAAASDARSEAAPPAPEGLVSPPELDGKQKVVSVDPDNMQLIGKCNRIDKKLGELHKSIGDQHS